MKFLAEANFLEIAGMMTPPNMGFGSIIFRSRDILKAALKIMWAQRNNEPF